MESQHGVKAEFACDNHRHGNGRFVESVGEPTVQRKDGDLCREGEEKGQCNPEERSGGEGAARDEELEF